MPDNNRLTMEKIYTTAVVKHNGEFYERKEDGGEVTWKHNVGTYLVRVTSIELKRELEAAYFAMPKAVMIAGREIILLTKKQVEAGRPKDAYDYLL